MQIDDRAEWLEADGLGGFASGTANGVRTRRYHALLLAATTPPTGRMVLVNGFDAAVVVSGRRVPLSRQRYQPDVVVPVDAARVAAFTVEPWPRWEFDAGGGVRLSQEIVVERGAARTIVGWHLLDSPGDVQLEVRPFLSGRDYHALHHENGVFAFEPERHGAGLCWRPYPGVPAVSVLANADYQHAPEWYRSFLYRCEQERGLDDTEDLASPGILRWTLSSRASTAVLVLNAGEPAAWPGGGEDVVALARAGLSRERARRTAAGGPLERAAEAYIVRRGAGRTIVAGYPWFTDWGRDTFIALRGLCLATGRLDVARDVLVEWAGAVSEGMLPNRFPDAGETPEYNAVDAALWYVIAVGELLDAARNDETILSRRDCQRLETAVQQILAGHAAGTRFGIRLDDDGLLAAGVPGVQLTWMDAKVGERVITPRIGKPVEVQALWLNALAIGVRRDRRWAAIFSKGRASFARRFWNPASGSLHDVIDVNHQRGTVDASFRPNQIFAVGGLPVRVIGRAKARSIIDAVERRLVTPMGLRSLAPGAPGYAARYRGGPAERDAVYHQGTVWPWLLGAFVDAWVGVRGRTPEVQRDAAARFIAPLLEHLGTAGLGHVSEIADAEPPFTPGGCPFQAWSLGELIRAQRLLEEPSTAVAASRPAQPERAGVSAAG